ncbi:MAG: hypothetical protein K2W80_16055 [Burkholderiales bacterium]|nr:hypothetical protein [Burkholderiales bacterium]
MLRHLTLACLLSVSTAHAATVVTFYGDDDGFGIGVRTGTLADTRISNATPGDAPLTDAPMFQDALNQPQFRPTGSFAPFVVTGDIVSATLSLRVAGLRVGPVDNNRIFLDGFDIGRAPGRDLFGQVSDKPAEDTTIEELSVSLSSFFFPFLADGSVSLDRSRILQFTENVFAPLAPFQVDFIRLTIETRDPGVAVVPLPPAAPLLALGLAAVVALGRRSRGAPQWLN